MLLNFNASKIYSCTVDFSSFSFYMDNRSLLKKHFQKNFTKLKNNYCKHKYTYDLSKIY